MKVLIVDDSKAMRMIVRRSLRQAGLEIEVVEEAGNGKEALAALRAAPPDLVISDWNMPEMNGIELLGAIRSEGHRTPFGFVTSESTPEMQDRARDAGARFLLSKPFTPERLEEVLRPVMRELASA